MHDNSITPTWSWIDLDLSKISDLSPSCGKINNRENLALNHGIEWRSTVIWGTKAIWPIVYYTCILYTQYYVPMESIWSTDLRKIHQIWWCPVSNYFPSSVERETNLFNTLLGVHHSVESFKPLLSTSVCLWRLMAPQKSIQCSLSQQASERWYEARGLLQSLVNVVQVTIHYPHWNAQTLRALLWEAFHFLLATVAPSKRSYFPFLQQPQPWWTWSSPCS